MDPKEAEARCSDPSRGRAGQTVAYVGGKLLIALGPQDVTGGSRRCAAG